MVWRLILCANSQSVPCFYRLLHSLMRKWPRSVFKISFASLSSSFRRAWWPSYLFSEEDLDATKSRVEDRFRESYPWVQVCGVELALWPCILSWQGVGTPHSGSGKNPSQQGKFPQFYFRLFQFFHLLFSKVISISYYFCFHPVNYLCVTSESLYLILQSQSPSLAIFAYIYVVSSILSWRENTSSGARHATGETGKDFSIEKAVL